MVKALIGGDGGGRKGGFWDRTEVSCELEDRRRDSEVSRVVSA